MQLYSVVEINVDTMKDQQCTHIYLFIQLFFLYAFVVFCDVLRVRHRCVMDVCSVCGGGV